MRSVHGPPVARSGALLLFLLGACSGAERRAPAEPAVALPPLEAQGPPPRLEDYPADRGEAGRPIPVDLSSHPEAQDFQTVLRRGAAQGPNFAGQYTVVTWGCGTLCQRAMIVDARTGRVLTDLVAPLGFEYRLDSRLMVVNPPEAGRESPCPACETGYYLWEEERLLAIPPEAWRGSTPPPVAFRAMVARFRAEEEPPLLRGYAPAVVRTAWNHLVIIARDGSRHTFTDEVVGEDLRRIHLFRGYFEGIDAYAVERRYIPEGGQFLLVEARSGRTTEIDAPPVPSPDGSRFATASMDLVAGHSPNRIRIYRMAEGGPGVEWEIEPREWGAQSPTWLDHRTLRLERAMVNWNTGGQWTSPMMLQWDGERWSIERSPAHARDALLSFLSALGRGAYFEAAQLYGGSYDQLRAWNPEIDPEDRSSLLRSACEHNGLQCLGRAEVVREEAVSDTEVRFAVRLLMESGELFVRGPCCGASPDEMRPQSDFSFGVRREGGRYRVTDLPPYVP